MLKRLLIALLFLTLPNSAIHACSCIWGGPFADVAAESELVLKGKILGYGPVLDVNFESPATVYESMTIQVTEVIHGKYKSKTLVVLGDRGIDCRPYITQSRFPKKSDILLALRTPKKDVVPLSSCGEYSIQLKREDAIGKKWIDLKQVSYTVPLEELLAKISEKRKQISKDR